MNTEMTYIHRLCGLRVSAVFLAVLLGVRLRCAVTNVNTRCRVATGTVADGRVLSQKMKIFSFSYSHLYSYSSSIPAWLW